MRFRLNLPLFMLLWASLVSVQYAGDDNIEFTSFLADNKVNIQWTASERGKIQGFSLERSQDGKTFEAFKTISDEGKSPDKAEFLESDFEPLLGWSYYRIKLIRNSGKEFVTHSVPLFYGADRMKKGKLMVPDEISDENDKPSSANAADYNGKRLVFILRNPGGEEFYFEETITYEDNQFFLPTTAVVPVGEYMITACTKTDLLGLNLTLR